MKRLFFPLALILSFTAPLVCFSQQSEIDGLKYALERISGEQEYPVKLRYTITNTSDKTIHVLKWGTPLDGYNSDFLNVKSVSSVQAQYRGRWVSRIGPLPSDYEEIGAGQSISVEIEDLAEGYNIAEKADYTVSLWNEKVFDAVHKKPTAPVKRFLSPSKISAPPDKKKIQFRQLESRKLSPIKEFKKPKRIPIDLRTPQGGTPDPRERTVPSPGERPIPTEPRELIPPGQFRIQPALHTFPDIGRNVIGYGSEELSFLKRNRDSAIGRIEKATYSPEAKYEKRKDGYDEELEPEHISVVKQAYLEALKMAAETKVFVNSPFQYISSGDRYKELFGPWNIMRFAEVRRIVNSVYDIYYTNPPVRFYKGLQCDDSIVAYALSSQLTDRIICLCDTFLRLPSDEWPISKAAILYHELSHIAGALTRPERYGEECKKLAQDSPETAVHNADSYQHFAANVRNLRALPKSPPETNYFVQFRTNDGEYLSFQKDGGPVHAQIKNYAFCEYCTFILVDRNGGALSDGDEVYLLSSDEKQYVYLENGALKSTASAPTEQTIFIIKKMSGSGEIKTGDDVYVMSPETNHQASSDASNRAAIIDGERYFLIEMTN